MKRIILEIINTVFGLFRWLDYRIFKDYDPNFKPKRVVKVAKKGKVGKVILHDEMAGKSYDGFTVEFAEPVKVEKFLSNMMVEQTNQVYELPSFDMVAHGEGNEEKKDLQTGQN